jgi:hypothetical protein
VSETTIKTIGVLHCLDTSLISHRCDKQVRPNMAADANRDNLRRILLAAAPLFAEPAPLPPILQPATLTDIRLLVFGNWQRDQSYSPCDAAI